MKRLVVVVACVAASVLAADAPGAPGGGRIVPQQGIAGVRLGMTQAQVRAAAGAPARVQRGEGEIAPWTTWHYRTFSVTYVGREKVTQVTTTSRAHRTASGVGVGSTKAQLRSRVAGVRCRVEFGYDHCWVGAWQPGRTVTDFAVVRGKVTRVAVGYVID